MLVIDCRLPVVPQVAGVGASRDGVKVSSSHRQSAARHYRPGRRRETNDLDLLTLGDAHFIREVTGEVIWPGQSANDSLVSTFARQIAADRRAGVLPEGSPVCAAYLHRSAERLSPLGVCDNPFSGGLLEKALAVLGSRHDRTGRIDLVC